jgi:hypothetical protein
MSNQNEKIGLPVGVNASLSGHLRLQRNLWINVYSERKKQAISDVTSQALKKYKLERLAKEFLPLTF